MNALVKMHSCYKMILNSATGIALLDSTFLSNFYFRGQADAKWHLSSSLERMINSYYPQHDLLNISTTYEREMLKEFKSKYPLYAENKIPAEDENIEWLSIIQHYGGCTRLVDATESIFVALFMATQNSFNNADSAIWAINKNILNADKAKLYIKNVDKKAKVIPQSLSNTFGYNYANKFIGHPLPTGKCPQHIIAIKPKMSNERIAIQQGLFLFPTDITVPFLYNLDYFVHGAAFHEDIDDYFILMDFSKFVEFSQNNKHKVSNDDTLMFKITIPHNLKLGITKMLSQMNISSETLFPGLSGLSQSLNKLRFGYGEYIE